MNREEKSAVIDEITTQIRESDAIFAVDYRGITVTQVAELRTKLRDADATFRVTKNTLTEIAAENADVQGLKDLLAGPTALTFVRGDAAAAAKAVADFQKITELLAFKGGVLGGEKVDAAQLAALAKLPTRDVLYQQLVGVVASPISGLARTLNALIGGLAIQLGQINEKKQSGEIPAGEAPAAAAAPAVEEAPPAEEEAPAAAPEATEAPAEEPTEGTADTTDTTPQEN